jgi:hypothetical protein
VVGMCFVLAAVRDSYYSILGAGWHWVGIFAGPAGNSRNRHILILSVSEGSNWAQVGLGRRSPLLPTKINGIGTSCGSHHRRFQNSQSVGPRF